MPFYYALDALNYAYASGDSSTLHEIYLPDASPSSRRKRNTS